MYRWTKVTDTDCVKIVQSVNQLFKLFCSLTVWLEIEPLTSVKTLPQNSLRQYRAISPYYVTGAELQNLIAGEEFLKIIGYKVKQIRNNIQDLFQNTCIMSTKKPGLLTIKQPDPLTERRLDPSHECGLDPSFLKFFIKNLNFYSYNRAKWYHNISSDYKPHTIKVIQRLKEEDGLMQKIIISGECLEDWNKFMELRQSVQSITENCIRKEMKFCRKENLEQHIWKILYYNLIEFFKALISDSKSDQQATYFQTKLTEIIDDGLLYYNHMLDVLQNTYNFQLLDLLQSNIEYKATIKDNKFIQLALVSAQKYFLFLGDLSRYKETIRANSSNFALAKEYYSKAQRLIPSNGVPYNQLAFVALHSKNKFDAVYYYIRSLMASNPIETAKENLKVLFDEARKSYETNRKISLEHKSPQKTIKSNIDGLRQEIWIHPISGKSVNRSTMQLIENDNNDSELEEFNSKEIAKRFMTSFVHIHGKLITKIGMDNFVTCAKQMLKEFQRLLNCHPIPLPFHCFLQIICINVYTISEARKRSDIQVSGSRSDILDAALSISFCIFELVCRKFVDLTNFSSYKHFSDFSITIPEDAKTILPAIKTWTDWMILNVELWSSFQNFADYNICDFPLHSLRLLLNSLNEIKELLSDCQVNAENENAVIITPPEDVFLEGFPLITTAINPTYCIKTEKKNSMLLLRLHLLLHNGNDIFRVYNFARQKTVPHIVSAPPPITVTIHDSSTEDEENFDEQLTDICENNTIHTAESSKEIQTLIRRKMELEKRHKLQTQKDQRAQQILEQTSISQCIEVRPKYLIPDTNCFIDFLDHLITLATTKNSYLLIVPTVVINEIEGLSKGTQYDATINSQNFDAITKKEFKHNQMVGKAAKESLNFLRNKLPTVKCVTTKGSILNTLSFTAEDISTEKISNDDRILLAAVNVCPKPSIRMKDNVQYLLREVVLLTTDRNLRVKALAQNIPVRQVPDFMEWDATFRS